jgi:hypothetical protein
VAALLTLSLTQMCPTPPPPRRGAARILQAKASSFGASFQTPNVPYTPPTSPWSGEDFASKSPCFTRPPPRAGVENRVKRGQFSPKSARNPRWRGGATPLGTVSHPSTQGSNLTQVIKFPRRLTRDLLRSQYPTRVRAQKADPST